MFTVTITEKGGKTTTREFDQAEVSVGRIQGNDIVLAKGNISKKHVRIVNHDGTFVVIDAKSTNGTYVNGKRIDAPYDLRVGDKIFVGDYTLEIEGDAQAAPKRAAPSAKPGPEPKDDILSDDEWGGSKNLSSEWAADWGNEPEGGEGTEGSATEASDFHGATEKAPQRKVEPEEPVPLARIKPERAKLEVREAPRPEPKPAPAKVELRQPKAESRAAKPPQGDGYAQALRAVHERLLKSLDLRRMDVVQMGDEELRNRTRKAVGDIVETMDSEGALPHGVDAGTLIDDVLNEALGLGPLEELLHDDSITEILVNNAAQIFVERQGKLTLTDKTFSSNQAVLGVIERIVAPLGRRIDESSPMVDARLRDGSRVNAIIPPLALKGPTLTIRKFTREPLQVDDLVGFGTLTAEMASFLDMCVQARRNILISGGTGSGKTTTLNVLSGFIPTDERIVTIEDAAELKLDQTHVVSLESRPPNIEGKGAVTIRDLVRNALRMRPDRIVVGECRGGEALDMLQAMNTGHEGSLTTVHANSPRDALSRLETMVLMSGMELPVRAIRDQIASAINMVVHQSRLSDGSRRLTHISEITGMEADVISMQDIFVFAREGVDAKGKVVGHHRPTGFVPKFYETLKGMGLAANMEIFRK